MSGAVTAQVRTSDGWAVPHAVLTITDLTGQQVSRTTADDDGTVTASLPAGTYTAILTAAGYTPVAKTAMIRADNAASLGIVTLTRNSGRELPPPGVWTIDPAHTTIGLIARHLGLSNIRGRFTEFTGRIEITQPIERSRVHAVIQAASIDTGNTQRDAHLRSPDFLDTERLPTIEYHSTGLTQTADDSWTLHGELSLHGTVRPVPLELTYLSMGPDPWGGTRATFQATTELHREDFGISFNQVIEAGISMIGATVRVELDVQAVRGETLPGL